MKKQKVICNKCGNELILENGILREDGLFVTKDWGYFSHKDLQTHQFCLCERCYDELVNGFAIPIQIKDKATAVD